MINQNLSEPPETVIPEHCPNEEMAAPVFDKNHKLNQNNDAVLNGGTQPQPSSHKNRQKSQTLIHFHAM